jgi:DNA-binding MarR family transcriptional regulator
MVDRQDNLTSLALEAGDLALLVTQVNGRVGARIHGAHERAGVPARPGHGPLLRALELRPMTLTALGAFLGVTKQAVGPVVDDMEAAGLVERRPSPDDRRAKLVALTAEGRRARRIAQAECDAIERDLAERLGPAGVEQMRDGLRHLLDRDA